MPRTVSVALRVRPVGRAASSCLRCSSTRSRPDLGRQQIGGGSRPRRGARRRRTPCSCACERRGRARRSRRSHRLHVRDGRQGQRDGGNRGGSGRRRRDLWSDGRPISPRSIGGPRALGRSCRVRKLLRDRRDVPGGGAPGGASPRPLGDHRLCERSETRRPERDGARARGAPRRDSPARGGLPAPRSPWTRRRLAASLSAVPKSTLCGFELRRLHRSRLRPARRAADDPP